MNDFEKPLGNYLEISHEELGELFATLAEKLVIRGDIDPIEDAFLHDEDTTPFGFEYSIPNLDAKHIFYPNDPEVALIDARVHYEQPHRIDEFPNDQLVRTVNVILHSRLIGTDILVNQLISLYQDNKIDPYVSGTVHVEYSDANGKRLNTMPTDLTGTYDEVIVRIINSRLEGERPLMLGDVEQLRGLIDHLS